jgi:hypothetical protein
MDPLSSLVIIIPLIVFWLWMFWAMTNNEELPVHSKYYWALAFLVGNVFAAAYYYVTVYRNRP